MTLNFRTHDARLIQYAHEFFFSMNATALAIHTVVRFGGWSTPAMWLYGLNGYVTGALHEPRSDTLQVGYSFFIFAALGTFCIWTVLRLFSARRFTEATLLYLAGATSLLGLPLTKILENKNWLVGWADGFDAIEVVDVIIMAGATILFIHGSKSISLWSFGLLFVLHTAFWLWVSHRFYLYLLTERFDFGIGEDATFLISVVSGIAWILYAESRRKVGPR